MIRRWVLALCFLKKEYKNSWTSILNFQNTELAFLPFIFMSLRNTVHAEKEIFLIAVFPMRFKDLSKHSQSVSTGENTSFHNADSTTQEPVHAMNPYTKVWPPKITVCIQRMKFLDLVIKIDRSWTGQIIASSVRLKRSFHFNSETRLPLSEN